MRVLLYGAWPELATGYGKVMGHIVRFLEGHDVTVFGIQKVDGFLGRRMPGSVPMVDASSPGDPMGLEQLQRQPQPDLLVVYNNPGACARVLESVRHWRCRKAVYLDLLYPDGQPQLVARVCATCDVVATFTRHAVTDVQIGHGCERRPMVDADSRQAARRALGWPCFEVSQGGRTPFVVLNMNRNSAHKRLDIFVQAAALALQQQGPKSRMIFVMNTSNEWAHDIFHIFNVMVARLGLPERSRDAVVPVFETLTDQQVELLMASADIGVTCSAAEGWGLCAHEHAAMGVPQVVTPVGILPEMFGYESEQSARFLPVVTQIFGDEGAQCLCSPHDLARTMLQMAQTPAEVLMQEGARARERTQRYDWDMAHRQWQQLMDRARDR